MIGFEEGSFVAFEGLWVCFESESALTIGLELIPGICICL